MKKKIINGIMMVALVAATSTSFVSCKDTNEDVKIEQAAEIAQLKGRLTTLENKYGDLDGRISALSSRVDNHAEAIETLQKEVTNLEIWLLETFSKLVTSVEISGTYNNMTGSINIPGFEPKMLISNYGVAAQKGSFPASAEEFDVTPIEWAANDELGQGTDAPGFAGYIYATINRYLESVPMADKEDDGFFAFSLVNTAGEEVPGLIVKNVNGGEPTTDVLQWGWTRADNNVYKFDVTYTGSDAKKFVPTKIDLTKFKEDLKAVWRDRNRTSGTSKQSLGHLAADLYYNLATKDTNLQKYALKVAWTDNENEGYEPNDEYEYNSETETIDASDAQDMDALAHKTTSEAELVFATIKPLGFNSGEALAENVHNAVASTNRLVEKSEVLWNKIFDKVKSKLPNLDPNQIATIVSGTNLVQNADGSWTLDPAGTNIDVTELIDPLNTSLESVRAMLDQAQGLVDKLNGSTITNWVEKFTNKFDKLFANNADQMLQPVLLSIDKDGYVNRISGLKASPLVVDGEVRIEPTTYTAEIFAPAFLKFVGCKDIDADGFNQILFSNDKKLKFTPESGKTYEIVYEAVDFLGNTFEHKYYIQGK